MLIKLLRLFPPETAHAITIKPLNPILIYRNHQKFIKVLTKQ